MTDQKITMDGKWAYRRDPFTQVRILCVDAAGDYPVASLDECGDIETHYTSGTKDLYHEDPFDLVPLKVKREPREVWVVEHVMTPFALAESLGFAYGDEATARRRAGNANTGLMGKVTRFREVMDEE